MAAPLTLAVTGGTGFLGRHLLRALEHHPQVAVRALSRRRPVSATASVVSVPGDLFDRASLRRLITPGSVVVNLAWDFELSPNEWPRLMGDLAAACAEAGAARLLHCSSTSVYGAAAAPRLDEASVGVPLTLYERAKASAESALVAASRGRVPLMIARPTTVFGSDGRALRSLAASLCGGSRAAAFLRSCIFGRRHMHLSSVENVVAALLFLAQKPMAVECETFVVSEDDDPINNFRDVEQRLMAGLGVRGYAAPRPAVPAAVQSALLRQRGRSDARPDRVYDGSRLLAAGFTRPRALAPALDDFARWYVASGGQAGGAP
jgi:nucleoside-diphosphate-sugar epimerase